MALAACSAWYVFLESVWLRVWMRVWMRVGPAGPPFSPPPPLTLQSSGTRLGVYMSIFKAPPPPFGLIAYPGCSPAEALPPFP